MKNTIHESILHPMSPNIRLSRGDLSPEFTHTGSVAIDTETLGLNIHRDRLCVVQISAGDGTAEVIQIVPDIIPERLIALLHDDAVCKIFHYGRFDIGILAINLGVLVHNVYCTKIASRLIRTYTDRHGLKELCREILSVDLNKAEQSSDWGREDLSQAQVNYAAQDVLYLHQLKAHLDAMLAREDRTDLAQVCFDFLPERALLDTLGFEGVDVFNHS